MQKRSLLILVMAFIGSSAISQVNLQLYGSFVQNLEADNKGSAFGGGLRVEFGDEDEPFTYYAGIAYNSPIKTTRIIQAAAYSGGTNPPTVPVTATYKLSSFRTESGARYYFMGGLGNDNAFNFFANLGAELFLAFNNASFSNYDENLYGLGYSGDSEVNDDGSQKFALNIMLAGGFGIEKNVGFGNLFSQVALSYPVIKPRTTIITSPVERLAPIPLNINVGIKIPLDK
jgi:hypothetical protein